MANNAVWVDWETPSSARGGTRGSTANVGEGRESGPTGAGRHTIASAAKVISGAHGPERYAGSKHPSVRSHAASAYKKRGSDGSASTALAAAAAAAAASGSNAATRVAQEEGQNGGGGAAGVGGRLDQLCPADKRRIGRYVQAPPQPPPLPSTSLTAARARQCRDGVSNPCSGVWRGDPRSSVSVSCATITH